MIDEDRLETLLNAYFDQHIGEEELSELEAILLQSSRARQILNERAEQHGLLREWALRENGLDIASIAPAGFRRRRLVGWTVAALAACVALLLALRQHGQNPGTGSEKEMALDSPSPPERIFNEVALLAEQIDVEWTPGSQAFETGSVLQKGPFSIEKGLVRLDFFSGAKVYLEGPATLELVSPDLARLASGKLTAQVPPPAHGFTILSEAMRVVDRGTEFGMNIEKDGKYQIHVFDGEVELHPEDQQVETRSLFGGGAVAFLNGASRDFPADRKAFADPDLLQRAAKKARDRDWRQWESSSEKLRQAEGLLVYYDFSSVEGGSITNRAESPPEESDGILIGCEPVPGRWPQKNALGFARTSDRLRFRLDGQAPSVTMFARVRVDSLPHDHNALLSMSPGEIGEIHWKLDRDGRLLLGIRAERELKYSSWERLVSSPVVAESDLGHWITLATVIDGELGEMRHYVDGREVAVAPMSRAIPLHLGKANVGNFDAPENEQPDATVTRNFNGRFSEFAFFNRALSVEELSSYQ